MFSYEFKDWFGRHGLDRTSLARFHAALLEARSDFVLQALRPPKLAPSVLVWKEVRYHQWIPELLRQPGLDRLVYLFRRPLDVINSWYLAPREFRAGQDIRCEYLHAPSKNTDPCEYNGLARWKASMAMALAAAKQHGARLQLVSYEQLRVDPLGHAAVLFDSLDLPLGDSTRQFLALSTSLHEEDAYSVLRARRTPIELPADVVQAIEQDAEAEDLLGAAEMAAQSVSV